MTEDLGPNLRQKNWWLAVDFSRGRGEKTASEAYSWNEKKSVSREPSRGLIGPKTGIFRAAL